MIYERTKNIRVTHISCNDKDRYLPPQRSAIDTLKKSLAAIGQIHDINVYPITTNTYRVITGATRFRAASELGWRTIRASVWSGSVFDFQLHELHENLQRHELTGKQRQEMRAKIKELQRQQLASIPASKGGRSRRGGLSEAARQQGISRTTAQRRQQEAKPAQNEISGQVSRRKRGAKMTNHAISWWQPKLYGRLLSWCERESIGFADGVRRICQERMDIDMPEHDLQHASNGSERHL